MAPVATSSSPPAGSNDMAMYKGYDHVHWYVGNAKQAASYYVTRMGFERVAYRGLETGSKATASHVIRNGTITFVLTSPLRSLEQVERVPVEEQQLLRDVHAHLTKHGDGVKDVAFEVDSVDQVFNAAVRNGAKVVSEVQTVKDKDGAVKYATIQTYGETTHTLIERSGYKGMFLPGYRVVDGPSDPANGFMPEIVLQHIDHCVGNQDWNEMENACD